MVCKKISKHILRIFIQEIISALARTPLPSLAHFSYSKEIQPQYFIFIFPVLVQYIVFPPIPILLAALHSVFCGSQHCHSTGDGGGQVLKEWKTKLQNYWHT